MGDEGRLQIKMREVGEGLKKIEEKEKILSLRLKKAEEILFKFDEVVKEIEEFKKVRYESEKLPNKIKEIFQRELDDRINERVNEDLKIARKELEKKFKIQTKLNADDMNIASKKYITHVLSVETILNSILGVLVKKHIVTNEEFANIQKSCEARVKKILSARFKVGAIDQLSEEEALNVISGHVDKEAMSPLKENEKPTNKKRGE